MQIRHAHIFSLLIAIVATLPGCGGPYQGIKPLKPIKSYLGYHEDKEEITVQVRKLSHEDSVHLFGSHASSLYAGRKGISTLQISITNNSSELIVLKPEHIDLPLIDYHTAARRLQRNPGLHGFGAAAGTLLTGGTIFGAGLTAIILSPPLFLTGIATCACAPFILLIGSPVMGSIRSNQIQKQNLVIKKMFKKHALYEPVIIEPGHTVDKLLFVEKKKLKTEFAVQLIPRPHPEEPLSFVVRLAD